MTDLPDWATIALYVFHYIVVVPAQILMGLFVILAMIAFPASLFWFAIRGIAPTGVGGFERIGTVSRLVCAAVGCLSAWAIFGLFIGWWARTLN